MDSRRMIISIVAICCMLPLILAEPCTMADCESCDNQPFQCDRCQYHHALQPDNMNCIECDTDCAVCVTTSKDVTRCVQCNPGYYLKSETAKVCTACPTACKRCHSDGNAVPCTECFQKGEGIYSLNHTLLADNTCLACTSNCDVCRVQTSSMITQCTKCHDKYTLKSSDKTCAICPNNCKKCMYSNEKKVCTTCDKGYELSAQGTCLKCPELCETCSGEEQEGVATCISCKPHLGLAIVDGSCQVCTSACDTCAGDSSCHTCKKKFYLTETKDCEACDPNFSRCDVCIKEEDEDTELECSDCQENYGPSKKPTCDALACHSNCICKNEQNLCSGCVKGYTFVDDGNKKRCLKNIPNCASNNKTDEYVLFCEECNEGYALPSSDVPMSCLRCTSNCLQCKRQVGDKLPECIDCEKDYEVKEDVCQSCPTYCSNCTAALCIECHESYYLDSNKNCQPCEANCKLCNSTTCLQCRDSTKTQYYKQPELRSCKACSSNCNCDSESNTCMSCYNTTRYTLDTSGSKARCRPCPRSCNGCSYNEGKTTCTTCSPKYTKHHSNEECIACPDNCATCEFSDSNLKCTDRGCDNYYGIVEDGTCQACPSHCIECEMNDNKELVCSKCDINYKRNEEICSICPTNCLECRDDQGTMACTKCKNEYALDGNNQCNHCPSSCLRCTGSPPRLACLDCREGYGISTDKLCTPCSELTFDNCNKCTDTVTGDPSQCQRCASGYVLNDEKTQCLDTSSLTNCAVAVDKAPTCSKCHKDYIVTPNALCAIQCYSCGSIKDRIYVSSQQCHGETIDDNKNFTTEYCVASQCVQLTRNVNGVMTYARGCQSADISCEKGSKQCVSRLGREDCQYCCKDGKCNAAGVMTPLSLLTSVTLLVVGRVFASL